MHVGKANLLDGLAAHALVWRNRYHDRRFVDLVHDDRIKKEGLDMRVLPSDVGGNRLLRVKDPDVSALAHPIRKTDADPATRRGNDEIREYAIADDAVVDPADADSVRIARQSTV